MYSRSRGTVQVPPNYGGTVYAGRAPENVRSASGRIYTGSSAAYTKYTSTFPVQPSPPGSSVQEKASEDGANEKRTESNCIETDFTETSEGSDVGEIKSVQETAVRVRPARGYGRVCYRCQKRFVCPPEKPESEEKPHGLLSHLGDIGLSTEDVLLAALILLLVMNDGDNDIILILVYLFFADKNLFG